LIARNLGQLAYLDVWQAMQAFTRSRPFLTAEARFEQLSLLASVKGALPAIIGENLIGHESDSQLADADELWFVEHFPVYTQGQAGKAEHILSAGNIPVVQTDRGGQVTYHGPGQLVVYVLLNLKSRSYGVREMVIRLEHAVIALLAHYGVVAYGRRDAPGGYVEGAKIAALGLRVSRGYTYHGFALNVNPDLAPFQGINPCGFSGLAVTSLAELGVSVEPIELHSSLVNILSDKIGLPN